MRLNALAAVLWLVAAGASAQDGTGFQWKQNDQAAPDDPSRASKDGFGVMMLVTDDPKGFVDAWAGPTPPNISTTERAIRGKPVEAMILVSGCRTAASGNCDVAGELSIMGPDGKPYGETYNAPVWQGSPGPRYSLQLSQSGIGFVLDPEDKLGTYTLRAKITDKVAGTTLSVEKAIIGEEKGTSRE
jgi:hypothetical protein